MKRGCVSELRKKLKPFKEELSLKDISIPVNSLHFAQIKMYLIKKSIPSDWYQLDSSGKNLILKSDHNPLVTLDPLPDLSHFYHLKKDSRTKEWSQRMKLSLPMHFTLIVPSPPTSPDTSPLSSPATSPPSSPSLRPRGQRKHARSSSSPINHLSRPALTELPSASHSSPSNSGTDPSSTLQLFQTRIDPFSSAQFSLFSSSDDDDDQGFEVDDNLLNDPFYHDFDSHSSESEVDLPDLKRPPPSPIRSLLTSRNSISLPVITTQHLLPPPPPHKVRGKKKGKAGFKPNTVPPSENLNLVVPLLSSSGELTSNFLKSEIIDSPSSAATPTLPKGEIVDLTSSDVCPTLSKDEIVDLTSSDVCPTLSKDEIVDLTSSDVIPTLSKSDFVDLTSSDVPPTLSKSEIVDLTSPGWCSGLSNSETIDLTPSEKDLPQLKKTRRQKKDEETHPIDLNEDPPSSKNIQKTSSPPSILDTVVASTINGIQIPESSFRRILRPGEWLDDLCLDFFGFFLTKDSTLASGCFWISWAMMNSSSRGKISPEPTSSLPAEIVAPLNWNNSHWGLLGYSSQEKKYWFFDSMNFYVVSSFQKTTFLTCCSMIFPGRFSSGARIQLSKIDLPKQRDAWSCGIRCLYFLLTRCDPNLKLPKDPPVESMRVHLLNRFHS